MRQRTARLTAVLGLLTGAGVGGGLAGTGATRAELTVASESGSAVAFVGASTCRECHAGIHTRWTNGRHSKMVQPATSASVKGDFTRGGISLRGKRYGLRAKEGAYFIRESYLQTGERERRVELTLGNRRVQHYLTRLDDGRVVVLPPSWDVERREWFHNMEIVDLEESSERPVQVWSSACFGCHVSGQEKVRDSVSGVVTSRWTDFGTTCERCHGPGAAHVDYYRGGASAATPAAGSSPPANRRIVRPTRLPPREASMVCAQCHSLRDVTAAGFVAGADYFDHFLPVLEYAQKRSSDPAYWGDGRPRRFSNDALGLWQSECFLKGGATCVTCHVDPHEPDVDRNPHLEEAALCTRCHEEQGGNPAGHSRHAATSARCVDCHMPKTIVGVRAHMRDHAISVPLPEATARFGIPNACGQCHQDQGPAWAAQWIAAGWPDASRRDRHLNRAAVFARARARDEGAVSALVALADDSREGAVVRANALGHLRLFPADPHVSPALVRGLSSGEPLMRAVAALGFVDVRASDEARASLGSALADPRRTVRVGAALALANQGVVRLEGAAGEQLRHAQAEYAQRAALNPDDPGALLDVGKFHLATSAWDRALSTLSDAFALEPDREGLRYHLALALLRGRRVDEGRRLLQGVPPADPFHGPARQILARLEAAK